MRLHVATFQVIYRAVVKFTGSYNFHVLNRKQGILNTLSGVSLFIKNSKKHLKDWEKKGRNHACVRIWLDEAEIWRLTTGFYFKVTAVHHTELSWQDKHRLANPNPNPVWKTIQMCSGATSKLFCYVLTFCMYIFYFCLLLSRSPRSNERHVSA